MYCSDVILLSAVFVLASLASESSLIPATSFLELPLLSSLPKGRTMSTRNSTSRLLSRISPHAAEKRRSIFSTSATDSGNEHLMRIAFTRSL